MPRLGRLSAILTVALFSSACCSIFGENTTGLAGPFVAVAFDDGGSDIGLGGDLLCDCDRFAGVRTGVGLDLFFPDFGNYQMGRVFADWMPEVGGRIRPSLRGGLVLKRHSYDSGFESPGLDLDDSSTNLGFTAGIGAEYDGLDRAVPFATLDRTQVDGGGFQVFRVGTRIRLQR